MTKSVLVRLRSCTRVLQVDFARTHSIASSSNEQRRGSGRGSILVQEVSSLVKFAPVHNKLCYLLEVGDASRNSRFYCRISVGAPDAEESSSRPVKFNYFVSVVLTGISSTRGC